MAFDSINDLKAYIQSGNGLAMTNRFQVTLSAPPGISFGNDMREFTVLCESAIIPGKQITTSDYQLLRQPIKMVTSYMNEDVIFSFLLTNNYSIKKAFDAWIEQMISVEKYRAKYKNQYTTSIQIYQLDKNNNPTYGVRLNEAFPITMNAVTLDNTAENAIQKLFVTLAYTDYEVLSSLN
jgi:Leu/Phe-tRNA-protein transferase